MAPEFHYSGVGEEKMLSWAVMPPFGRKVYSFRTGAWGYLD
jgi:hypothetical protein